MKNLIYILVLLAGLACKKSNESKTCWDCTVYRRDGTTFTDKPCTDGSSPQYMDNNGNDLNYSCTKR